MSLVKFILLIYLHKILEMRMGQIFLKLVVLFGNDLSEGTTISAVTHRQKLSSNLENSIIEQQRQEIHLLTAELKDRDKELTDMVAVHQKQLLAWERDRQKTLSLAEQCNLLKNELKKRNEMIKSLTQQKLKEMSQKVADATARSQTLKEKNQRLHCSVLELSAKTGQLQAREQELLSMLKLKDEVILEKTDRITEFTFKFRKLESALCAAKAEKFNLIRKIDDLTLRLEELMVERNKLKDGLCEMVKDNNKKEEEIIQLRQENGCLRNELVLTVEKAKRVEQFLQFAKSKQARTNTELECLRQMYLKQQCDLQFLHVALESSQELSEEIVNLDYFHLESICLTSTQKRDKSQTCEKSSDEDFPLEINYPSVTEPTNGCCRTTMDQRPSSPTSKLYHLLAECQQVAADLELSLLLRATHCCSTNSSNANRAPELAEASHRTQLPAAEERSMMFCEHEDNRIKDMNIVE